MIKIECSNTWSEVIKPTGGNGHITITALILCHAILILIYSKYIHGLIILSWSTEAPGASTTLVMGLNG